ncbi:hypothetical protein BJ875DRAFT_483322 [Amylocarpus encephaloides]|uniref:Uncharacterized protein n=1 Tax=Amylocarpus encephaloides TaxID=45428 RepID=A0A9P7YKC4_9HELO|nr:hypothetical protein BJ875DRAFT_483322 [Amylocarpus encephaloides]
MLAWTTEHSYTDIQYPTSLQDSQAHEYFRSRRWRVTDPDLGVSWLMDIGHSNIQSITKLWVRTGCGLREDTRNGETRSLANGDEWLTFFGTLADQATRIRELVLDFDFDMYPTRLGAGDNIALIRVVARLKNLRHIRLNGGYAKGWVTYLKIATDAMVVEEKYLPGNIGSQATSYLANYQELCRNRTT